MKVLYYEPESSKVFVNTDIKGGVAITLHDVRKVFGAIEIFTIYTELNTILKKVREHGYESLSDLVYSPES